MSSILGRLLNFALTPIHTGALSKEGYGQNVDIYSIIAFLMVILTFGMETAFFRFRREHQSSKVFSTASSAVIGFTVVFLSLIFLFLDPISSALRYGEQQEIVILMALIVCMDAWAAVPFARLRAENKAFKFVAIRLGSTLMIISLNLVFFVLFPYLYKNQLATGLTDLFYDPELGVMYVFIANLIGNIFLTLLFLPSFLRISWKVDRVLIKQMLFYASPLVIAGLAGIANEMLNRQFLKFLLPGSTGIEATGVFGANAKVATFMMLFIQAFRFAAEPFFFSGEGNFKEKMANVMRYFVAIQTVIFLGLVCYIDLIRQSNFIDEKFWEGLPIVPVLIFANLLLGINFNLNIWYKLKNMTRIGAYISFLGLFFTIVANIILIPKYSYVGAAWSTLISYAAMTIYSYYLNQKHDRTKYPVYRIGSHIGLSVLLAYLSFSVFHSDLLPSTICFLSFLIYIYFTEGRKILKPIRK